MSDADFTTIESALELRLPESYKAGLAVYPFPKEEMELFASAEEVVRQNQEYRKEGWFDFPWPRNFFIIGEDGCGNLYFMFLGASNARVFLIDHDGGPEPVETALEEMPYSVSLDAHVAETVQTLKVVAERHEKRLSKKWWHFWR